jgi:hypothetical protein
MFKKSERNIFRHEVGGRTIVRDPMKVDRRLEAGRPANWSDLAAALDQKRPDGTEKTGEEYFKGASPALDVVIPYLCRALDVHPLTEDGADGLTEEEIIDLHNAFQAFKKKRSEAAEETPSSSPSTPAPTPSSGAAQVTAATSDCGCGDT